MFTSFIKTNYNTLIININFAYNNYTIKEIVAGTFSCYMLFLEQILS